MCSCQPDGAALRFGLGGYVPIASSVPCGSDNLVPEPPNTAYNCGQHGPVTAWFRSGCGQAMLYLFQKHLLCWE